MTTLTLHTAPLNSPVALGCADIPCALRLRLAELGLRSGARVTVVQRTAGGGRVVKVGPSRVALDASVCRILTAAPAAA